VQTTAAELGTQDVSHATELGVETQVRALASSRKMLYLETAGEQLAVMDGFSPKLQEYMLRSACETIITPESLRGMDASLRHWPGWWTKGDAEAFSDAYQMGMQTDPEPALMQEYHEGLVRRRNENMALKLAQMLESDENSSFFVTVGLLHLVLPDDSIPACLQSLGYQVERITE